MKLTGPLKNKMWFAKRELEKLELKTLSLQPHKRENLAPYLDKLRDEVALFSRSASRQKKRRRTEASRKAYKMVKPVRKLFVASKVKPIPLKPDLDSMME